MKTRHYLGQQPHITFTADWHELLTGDLRPGETLHIHYDPRRLPDGGQPVTITEQLTAVTVRARFRDGGPIDEVALPIPGGLREIFQEPATTRAAVLYGHLEVPADAQFISLWFVGTTLDGGERVDDDHGSTFLFSFPSCDLGTPKATVTTDGNGSFHIELAAAPTIHRITVRYRVVNDPTFTKREFDLTRNGADEQGRTLWRGSAAVASPAAIVRYKIHYWLGTHRFKEDNGSTYFLAPEPPADEVPQPPAELVDAARAFAVPATAQAQDAVHLRAHAIWQEEGRPQGRALDNWFAAREELADKGLGEGHYSAWQQGARVTVCASGHLPQGLRASLERHTGDGAFEYILLFRRMETRPDAPAREFTIERQVNARGSVAEVVIHDRRGPHPIKVGTKPPT